MEQVIGDFVIAYFNGSIRDLRKNRHFQFDDNITYNQGAQDVLYPIERWQYEFLFESNIYSS